MAGKIDNKGYDPMSVTVSQVIMDNNKGASVDRGFAECEGYGQIPVREAEPKEGRIMRVLPGIEIKL